MLKRIVLLMQTIGLACQLVDWSTILNEKDKLYDEVNHFLVSSSIAKHIATANYPISWKQLSFTSIDFQKKIKGAEIHYPSE